MKDRYSRQLPRSGIAGYIIFGRVIVILSHSCNQYRICGGYYVKQMVQIHNRFFWELQISMSYVSISTE